MTRLRKLRAVMPKEPPRNSMAQRLRTVLSLVIAVLVPALLLLSSIRLLMTETYLTIEYHKPDFPPDQFGFSLEDRLTYGPIAMRYLLNSEGPEYLNQRPLPDGSLLFDEKELEHMRDVKTVVQAAMLAFAALTALFLACMVILLRTAEGRIALRGGLFSGGGLLIALLSILVIYVLIDWSHFFDSFHNLFFAPGSWQFRIDESLIRLFPIRFWQDAALTVGGMSVVGALGIMAVSWAWRRRVLSKSSS